MAGKIIVCAPPKMGLLRMDLRLNGRHVVKLKKGETFEYKITQDTYVSGKIFDVPESEKVLAKDGRTTRIVFEYISSEIHLKVDAVEMDETPESNEKTHEFVGSEEQPVLYFDGGVKDILLVYEDRIVIQHKGFANMLAMDGVQGDKTVYYSDLTAVQFKRAGKILSGHIQFSMVGGLERRGGIFSAASDENSITFIENYNQQAEEVCKYINDKLREIKSLANKPSVVTQQISSADEIKKFKELLDLGVITQEEFDTKKKELLGL